MYDFTIIGNARTTSHFCRIWRYGDRRTYAKKGNFRTYEQAEAWANRMIEQLEIHDQEFARDPITQYYGL